MSTEERNVRVSVQEALVMMIDAYKDIGRDAEKQKELEAVLLDNIVKVDILITHVRLERLRSMITD